MEVLRVQGLDLPLSSCVWIRTSPGASPTSAYSPIPNTDNKVEYTLTADDVNCYISIRHAWVEEIPGTDSSPATNQVKVIQAEHAIGPVTAGPARLLDLRILSRPLLPSTTPCNNDPTDTPGILQVHYCVVAQENYIGGKQGCSEFWWLKTYPDGTREELTKRLPISNTASVSTDIVQAVHINTKTDVLSDTWRLDPRVYVLKPEDIGCTLKVKCIPVRSDGYTGEVVTSKPSAVIIGEHGEIIGGNDIEKGLDDTVGTDIMENSMNISIDPTPRS